MALRISGSWLLLFCNFEHWNNPASVTLEVPISGPTIVHVPRALAGTTVGAPLRG